MRAGSGFCPSSRTDARDLNGIVEFNKGQKMRVTTFAVLKGK